MDDATKSFLDDGTVMKFGILLDGPDLMEQNLQVLFLEELETQNSSSLRLYPVDVTRMVLLKLFRYLCTFRCARIHGSERLKL